MLAWYPGRQEEGVGSPVLHHHWVGAGLNPGSLEEQRIILTAEPAFHYHPTQNFKCLVINLRKKSERPSLKKRDMTLNKEFQGTKDFYSPRLAEYCENG